MAWIESHTVLIRHRKTIDLASTLKVQPVAIVGHLTAFWHSVLEQAEDGDISEWSDSFIASCAYWTGDAKEFATSLRQNGWVDGGIVHDWYDYAGKYLESKYRTSKPEILAKIRAKHGFSQTKDGLKTDFSQSKVCLKTVHQPTNLPNLPTSNTEEFHQKVIQEYHKVLPELPKVQKWTTPRAGMLTARIKEDAEREDITWWSKFFHRVKASNFLMSRASGCDFKADLEWLIKPSNLVKVIEGRYDNKGTKYTEFPPYIPSESEKQAILAHQRKKAQDEALIYFERKNASICTYCNMKKRIDQHCTCQQYQAEYARLKGEVVK